MPREARKREVLGVRLPPALADRIAAEAARRGVSESEVVRDILSRYFLSEEGYVQEFAEQVVPRLVRAVTSAVREGLRVPDVAVMLVYAVMTALGKSGQEIATVADRVRSALKEGE